MLFFIIGNNNGKLVSSIDIIYHKKAQKFMKNGLFYRKSSFRSCYDVIMCLSRI